MIIGHSFLFYRDGIVRLVMAGLDPIGANLRSSLPGLTRQSIDLRKNFLAKKMDARVKPAHDELAKQLKVVIAGLDPAIHRSS
jgi:hypothetical protein